MRALQVRNKASKDGSALTHAESVVFAFLEAARHSGMMDSATKALAEAQLSDANLRLGLSKARLPPLKFIVEVSGAATAGPLLLVDGARRSCKTVQLESHAHGRTYLIIWRPLFADCLGQDAGSPARRVSAAIEGDSGLLPLKMAWRDKPDEKSEHIDVVLDPQRSFYGFTTRKEIEVDIGLPAPRPADTDAGLMLKKMTKQLDNLRMTTMLFRIAYGTTPSGAIWSGARKIITEPATAHIAVTPRKKAAAALIAADMRHFAELGHAAKALLTLQVQKLPLDHRGAIYVCERGLIVPSEFSAAAGIEWADALFLAVKL